MRTCPAFETSAPTALGANTLKYQSKATYEIKQKKTPGPENHKSIRWKSTGIQTEIHWIFTGAPPVFVQ